MTSIAIAGVGYTEFSKASGRSVLSLATEACRAALADAGLDVAEVDGIGSFSLMGDSVRTTAVATALGTGPLSYAADFDLGGQAPCYLVRQAGMALTVGDARYVLLFRALNGRSGARVGTGALPGPAAQYRYPIGYGAWAMYMAMWAQRYLYETGQSSTDLAAVAIAQRRHAADNERAMHGGRPLDMERYMSARFLAEPFRIPDCPTEVDGGVAILVTTLDRARALRRPPAVVASTAFNVDRRPGLDMGDYSMASDYTRNFTGRIRDELYARAGVGAGDVDFAEIYDCSTSTVMMGLEGLGFCGRGEPGAFVASGATARDGSLPTNTHGGLLSEGYLHGMNTLSEAVLQLQGRAGHRQVPKHEVGVVTSGGYVDGSGLILTVDR